MAPRKKGPARKKKAKKTIRRGSVRRETPIEKLAFRVSILEEGFDVLEKDLRDLRGAYTADAVCKADTKPEAIDVVPESAKAFVDTPYGGVRELRTDDEL